MARRCGEFGLVGGSIVAFPATSGFTKLSAAFFGAGWVELKLKSLNGGSEAIDEVMLE